MTSQFANISAKPQDTTQYTIFVGSLSERTTQANVYRYFSKFGHVVAANLITDWTTGTSKRCAIVFCSSRDTYCSILGCSKHILDGKKIRVAIADQEKKGTKKISTNNLFVGNIPNNTSDSLMRGLFAKFGMILGIRFFRNASTKPNTKNAIVEYVDSRAVETAFKNKASLQIEGYSLKISPLKQKKTSGHQPEIGGSDEELPAMDCCDPDVQEEDCFAEAGLNLAGYAETPQAQEQLSEQVSTVCMPTVIQRSVTSDRKYLNDREETYMKEVDAGCCVESQLMTPEQADSEAETPGLSSERSLLAEDEESFSQEQCKIEANKFVTLIDIYGEDDIAMAFYKDSPTRKERIENKRFFTPINPSIA